MSLISIIGYAPDNINYCPRCGAVHFPHTICHGDGRMICDDCGLVCYIVEGEEE